MNSNVSHYGIIFVHQQKYATGKCIRRIKAVCELKTASFVLEHRDDISVNEVIVAI